jgi:enoyl-[acyl-carrier-protein] reductase (NADH)
MITRLEGIRKDYKASAINLSKDKSWFKRLFNANDNSTELEKNFYDIFDQKIRIDIDNIDQTLIDLKDMKKQVNKGTNMRVHAKNYQDIQIQTEYFDNQARRLADMLVGQDQYSNFSQTGFNLIDLTIRSSQDAKKMKEVFDKIVDEKQKINLLLHSVALDKIKSEQQESLQDYLNHVLEEDTVANDKFVP